MRTLKSIVERQGIRGLNSKLANVKKEIKTLEKQAIRARALNLAAARSIENKLAKKYLEHARVELFKQEIRNLRTLWQAPAGRRGQVASFPPPISSRYLHLV
jgi:hypothetical protein